MLASIIHIPAYNKGPPLVIFGLHNPDAPA